MEAPVYQISSSGTPDSVYIGNFHRDGCMGPDAFAQLDLPQSEAEVTHPTRDGGKCWMVQTMISAETIQTIYELPADLQPGHHLRANFYTACEATYAPYWGSWRPIRRPDFHLYEYFGLLEIT